jgi:predicted nucleic acid-binding protein
LLILDNTVLSNFALVDRTDLILSLAQWSCATTTAVMQEYAAGVIARGLAAAVWNDLPCFDLQPAEVTLADTLPRYLGLGERSAIALAIQQDAVLATDDVVARRVAQQQAIPVTGTLGLLVFAVRQRLLNLDEGNRLLAEMIAHGYHSPLFRLDELL